MRLSSLFHQGNQVHMENTPVDAATLEQNLKNGLEQVAGKASGETVSGTIVDKSGLDILIAIGKNQMLQARLEGNMQVDVGQQLTFAIKNAMGNKVILSPLFTNMANDPNISKALQMAGIPETEVSVHMVKAMMQEGMSIDKNSLQQMMRTINLNPQASVETLLQLARLNIPATEENIFQMDAYKNLQHHLTESIHTVADSLVETWKGMIAEGNYSEGIALYKEVVSMLGEQIFAETNVTAQASDGTRMQVLHGIQESPVIAGQENVQEVIALNGLDTDETLVLADGLKQAGFEELGDAVKNQQMDSKTLMAELGKGLRTEILPEQSQSVIKLLDSKEFHKLIKNEMQNAWMLKPEEVAEENKVNDLYTRLSRQLHRLQGAIEQTANQSPVAKAASNLAGNIDFMNQLNQMFTYIQLPLKLQGQEANGELFVYTNKKNLAKEDGEVSALLHLDMEHLGSVDVHVSMKEQKVATKFYLQDDSALDLIAGHIDILNERLNKRGYEMQASFIQKDSDKKVIEEILEQNKNVSVTAGYSFDARA